MARVLLDSSVWVSFFTKEDVNHKRAADILRNTFSPENSIVIPDLILCEILNVSYRIEPDKRYYMQVLDRIKLLKPIVTVYSGGSEFWLTFAPANLLNYKLKTSDAIICCYLEFLQIDKFHTFDKPLEKEVQQFRLRRQ